MVACKLSFMRRPELVFFSRAIQSFMKHGDTPRFYRKGSIEASLTLTCCCSRPWRWARSNAGDENGEGIWNIVHEKVSPQESLYIYAETRYQTMLRVRDNAYLSS